jgi:CDGSH-type Zn-finger protein
MMADPKMAQKGPYRVKVEAGRDYWWCACGESKAQPFCDGSHKTTSFQPVRHQAAETMPVYFCGCKRSEHKPLCDGTHSRL